MADTVIVTGGAGFIGSEVIRQLIRETDFHVVNIDKLTYAGNRENLASVADDDRYRHEIVDICDADSVRRIFRENDPEAVIHLAAESHVDRSIDGPGVFIQTNVLGTYTLLEAAREMWSQSGGLDDRKFIHVSTDEVYGSLGEVGLFTEETPYDPRSPYSASKASSDHLANAWFHTFGLPVMITNCSNNYGPFQFPEKLIPVVIQKAIGREPIPVYGKGDNVRDWLHVSDHARAIRTVLSSGEPGETYNIGGLNEKSNIEVVREICSTLDELAPVDGIDYADQITFVTDRPGHDQRYAIDASKIMRELGWKPQETFESGLRSTIEWYLENQEWIARILSGAYKLDRLGNL